MKINTIFVSAGEVSGDIHAADLMQKLKKYNPAIRFVGLGGKNMISAGLNSIAEDVSTLSTMGLTAPLRFYFKKYNLYKTALKYLKTNKITALIMVDNQGFNIPLAKAAKKLNIFTIYYFPPHVSIWGKWNAPILAKNTDLIIAPFHHDYLVYKQYTGKVFFFGHPLLDKITGTKKPQSIYKKYGLDPKKKIVSIMPGSRYQELETLLQPMLDASRILIENHHIQIILPVSHKDFEPYIIKKLKENKLIKKIKIIKNDSYSAMRIADVNILASGTASLESVLLKKPPVICYKISASSFFIGKLLVKNKMIGLPNIILNKKIFPELLQKGCSAENMVKEALSFIYPDKAKKSKLSTYYNEIKKKLGERPVISKAAELIYKRIFE